MNHLVVSQNSNLEVLGTSSDTIGVRIIEKLYELAHAGLDSSSSLSGNLQVSKAYRDSVEWLLLNTGLNITVTGGYYIKFLDSAVKEICKTNWGDSFGLTEQAATSITNIGNTFRLNTNIEYFDEFKYFTGITILNYLGHYASPQGCFQGCTNLKSIDLQNVEEIDSFAFVGCTSLEEVKNFNGWNIRNSTHGSQFESCGKLETINLSNVEILGGSAFDGCKKLKNIGDLKKVKYISTSVFPNCESLDIIIDMPQLGQPVTSGNINISSWEFYKKLSLSFVKSGITGVKDLGGLEQINNGFDYYSYISPNWNIGCFSHCTSLRYVILPSTLTKIGSYCFYNTPALEWVKCLATVPPTLGNTDPSNNAFPFRNSTCNFYVPDAVVNDYKAASGWDLLTSRIFPMSLFSTDFPND